MQVYLEQRFPASPWMYIAARLPNEKLSTWAKTADRKFKQRPRATISWIAKQFTKADIEKVSEFTTNGFDTGVRIAAVDLLAERREDDTARKILLSLASGSLIPRLARAVRRALRKFGADPIATELLAKSKEIEEQRQCNLKIQRKKRELRNKRRSAIVVLFDRLREKMSLQNIIAKGWNSLLADYARYIQSLVHGNPLGLRPFHRGYKIDEDGLLTELLVATIGVTFDDLTRAAIDDPSKAVKKVCIRRLLDDYGDDYRLQAFFLARFKAETSRAVRGALIRALVEIGGVDQAEKLLELARQRKDEDAELIILSEIASDTNLVTDDFIQSLLKHSRREVQLFALELIRRKAVSKEGRKSIKAFLPTIRSIFGQAHASVRLQILKFWGAVQSVEDLDKVIFTLRSAGSSKESAEASKALVRYGSSNPQMRELVAERISGFIFHGMGVVDENERRKEGSFRAKLVKVMARIGSCIFPQLLEQISKQVSPGKKITAAGLIDRISGAAIKQESNQSIEEQRKEKTERLYAKLLRALGRASINGMENLIEDVICMHQLALEQIEKASGPVDKASDEIIELIVGALILTRYFGSIVQRAVCRRPCRTKRRLRAFYGPGRGLLHH